LELELYVSKVGLSPLEAIVVGTLNGAKVMGLDDVLGTVDVGKYADLVLVEKNPLEDIGSLQDKENVKLVLRDGEVVKNSL
jgi:imidazolonepropionase-like amidohydrolase